MDIWLILEFFMYFSASYIVLMVFAFTVIMRGYHALRHKSVWRALRWPWYVVASVFLVLDIAYNYILTVWILELPRSPLETVTERVSRYKADLMPITRLEKWRHGFAVRLCKILDMGDPGHCDC